MQQPKKFVEKILEGINVEQDGGRKDERRIEKQNSKWFSFPYIKGLSERLKDNSKIFGVQIAHKITWTVGDLFTRKTLLNEENKHKSEKVRGVIYLITCHCGEIYIGETARTFEERKKEHLRYCNPQYKQKTRDELAMLSPVALHAHTYGHAINWDNSKILEEENRTEVRKFKEAILIQTKKPKMNLNDGMYINPIWKSYLGIGLPM